MLLTVAEFLGANKAIHPRLLPNGVGVASLNQRPGRGDLRPWGGATNVATVSGASTQTIYRMGRDDTNTSRYWLQWNTMVHAIRGFAADDPTEQTFFTGSGSPKWTDNIMGTATAPYPTATRELAVPAPISGPVLSITTAGTGTAETRYYVHTFVNDQGWESAPSPPTKIVCNTDAVISISSLEAAPSGNYGITLRRIYRTQSGQSGDTDFYFHSELSIGTTSTSDTGQALAERLPTQGSDPLGAWVPLPSNASWLTALWNGMAAAIVGKSIRFCEPSHIYAWPLSYELEISGETPRALGAWQQNLLVLTNGQPYLITGQDPSAMSAQRVEIFQPCVSPKSVVSMGHGVVWASNDGLCYVGPNGPVVLTKGLMLKEDWTSQVGVSSLVGVQFENFYFGSWYDPVSSSKKGFFIDPLNPTGLYFVDSGFITAFRDTLTTNTFVLQGANINQWNGGGAPPNAAYFLSKVFRAQPANFAYAQVVADAYPVTITVVADNHIVVNNISVANGQPFALPSGFIAEEWQVGVSIGSAGGVQKVMLAESSEELA